jgi:hypothetical protein
VVRVEEANEGCGLSDKVFKQWQTDAMNSFESRNAYALSIDRVQDGPIESRTIINLVDSMKGIVQSHGVSINLMSTSINHVMTANLAKLMATIAEMTRVQNLSFGQREILQSDKEHDENATAKAITLSSMYSQLMRTGKETPLLLDIAFYWFRYNTLQLFLNEKSTVATKKIGNRLMQHFSSIKSTMNVIIKNLDNYPDEVISDPTKIVPWERSLKAEVNAALERIKPHVKSPTRIMKAFVAEYNDIDFPEGTPEDVKVFFNDKGRNQGGRSKRPADESVALDSNTNKTQRSI